MAGVLIASPGIAMPGLAGAKEEIARKIEIFFPIFLLTCRFLPEKMGKSYQHYASCRLDYFRKWQC
jgi:hypothetical protein